MDTTLVTVTLLSMGMAAALSVIVWRMLREERQRTEARVIALTGLAARTGGPETTPVFDEQRHRPHAPRLGTERVERARSELPLHETPLPAGGMFSEPESSSPWGRRFVVMGALGLVLASVVLFALAASGSRAASRADGVPSAAARPAAAAPAPGLELLSLRDARQADALTITGLVHNPAGGALLTRVTVTAYAFDESGSFLASGRALLDVTALAPGDESPFVVSVPVTGTVARYRIGFRGEDGRVIAHVDKRQQASMAANW